MWFLTFAHSYRWHFSRTRIHSRMWLLAVQRYIQCMRLFSGVPKWTSYPRTPLPPGKPPDGFETLLGDQLAQRARYLAMFSWAKCWRHSFSQLQNSLNAPTLCRYSLLPPILDSCQERSVSRRFFLVVRVLRFNFQFLCYSYHSSIYCIFSESFQKLH